MTSGQRKAHKYIWLFLTILVPLTIVFSIKDLDIFSVEKPNTPSYSTSNKTNIKISENEIIKVSVFESHIEIILKTTLKNSSSVVYEMGEKGNKTKVIGQLTTAGIYNFNSNNLPKGVVVYDDIKQVEITKISF